jgi:hypothetical protein
LPSDADDLHQGPEAGEIIGITRVEHKPVRMSDGGDEQVSDAAPVGAAGLDVRGDDLAVAASGCDIEGNWFERCLDLL